MLIFDKHITSDEAIAISERNLETYEPLEHYDWETMPLETEPKKVVFKEFVCWEVEIPIAIHDEGLEGTSQAVKFRIHVEDGKIETIASSLV